MLRNLNNVKTCPNSPTRSCRYITGPGDSSLIRQAATSITGSVSTSNNRLPAMSRRRRMSSAIVRAGSAALDTKESAFASMFMPAVVVLDDLCPLVAVAVAMAKAWAGRVIPRMVALIVCFPVGGVRQRDVHLLCQPGCGGEPHCWLGAVACGPANIAARPYQPTSPTLCLAT